MPPSLMLNRHAVRPGHSRGANSPVRAASRRVADLIAGALLLLLTLPLLLLTALIVRLSGSGPLLQFERCLGAGGQVFALMTFRGPVDASGSSYPLNIAALSRLIYFTRLDQLPLLLNLVRGDVTLVGPCPRPIGTSWTQRAGMSTHLAPEQKPGLTGWYAAN